MNNLKAGLVGVGVGLAIFAAPLTPIVAAQDITAYDGQTLAGQSMATQDRFEATWGNQAALRWAMEHDMELVAIGVAPNSILDQYTSGAQVMPGMSPGMMPGAPFGPNENVEDDESAPGAIGIEDDESLPERVPGASDEDD